MPALNLPTLKSEALKPLLWFVGFTLGPSSVASFAANPFVAYTTLALGVLGSLVFLGSYLWLLFTDPNRLQSEQFLFNMIGDSRVGTQALNAAPVPKPNQATEEQP